MAEIYDIDYNTQDINLLPSKKRKPKFIAWVQSLTFPIQWLRDLFYNDYRNGFAGDAWDVSTTYVPANRVRYIDRAVYECILSSTPGVLPTDTTYWIKIQDLYIGIIEQAKYNSGKMVFEFLLNKWFEVAPLPADQIYIQNNVVDVNGFYVGLNDGFTTGQAGMPQNQRDFIGSAYAITPYDFTIFVPTAVYAALGSDDLIIRAIADKYAISGMNYNIITY